MQDNELLMVHLCADGVERIFFVPGSITLDQLEAMDSVNPEKDGWVLYGLAPTDGSVPSGLSTSCGQTSGGSGGGSNPGNGGSGGGTTPAEPDAPVWDMTSLLASRPKLVPGSLFVWVIPDDYVTVGSGAVFAQILAMLPPFLGLVYQNGTKISGNVPASLTAGVDITLTAIEIYTIGEFSKQKSTPATVSLEIGNMTPYANYIFDAASNQLTIRVGPYGGQGNYPYLTPTDPSGGVGNPRQMTDWGATVDGYDYFFELPIRNPAPGIWTVKIEFLGKTLYGSLTVPTTSKPYTGIALSTTPPVPAPKPEPKVTAVDYRYVKPAGGSPMAYLWFNVSEGADLVITYSSSLSNNQYQTDSADHRITGDAKGYTHSWNVTFDTAYQSGITFSFKVWPAGYPANFITFTVSPSGATTARNLIYPPANASNSGSSGNLAGGSTSSSAGSTDAGATVAESNNRANFSYQLQWQNGLARIVHLSPGANPWYFLSGLPGVNALPTDYVYPPGSFQELFYIDSSLPPEQFYNWSINGKAQLLIHIGNPPTN